MLYKYPGIIHIHTKYSDGREDIPNIALKAKEAGLKWIIITDHNTIQGYNDGQEGWYDGVAVLIGNEISPSKSNHYLALGVNEDISHNTTPQEYINKVNQLNGIGFIAHPDESLTRKNKFSPLRWEDWDIEGFTGLEIWNYMSDWVDNMSTKMIFLDYLRRHKILTGPTKNTLNWWDKLNKHKDYIVPAIGGVDAHTFSYKILGKQFNLFNYEDCFKTITNYIYLDKQISDCFEEAKTQILLALKNGFNTIINRCESVNNDKFEFYMTDNEKIALPGGMINSDKNINSVVKLPKNGIIRVIHNGNVLKEVYDNKLIYQDLSPGKYRVEVYNNKHPWIFTNPIIVS